MKNGCKCFVVIIGLCFVVVLLMGCSSESAKKQNEILDLMRADELDEAAAKLQDVLKSYPDDSKFLELQGLLANRYSTRGVSYINSRDYNKALADFNKSLEIKPGGNDKAYLGRGLVYQNLGNFQQARADYKKVIEINPKDQRTLKMAQEALRKLEGR